MICNVEMLQTNCDQITELAYCLTIIQGRKLFEEIQYIGSFIKGFNSLYQDYVSVDLKNARRGLPGPESDWRKYLHKYIF